MMLQYKYISLFLCYITCIMYVMYPQPLHIFCLGNGTVLHIYLLLTTHHVVNSLWSTMNISSAKEQAVKSEKFSVKPHNLLYIPILDLIRGCTWQESRPRMSSTNPSSIESMKRPRCITSACVPKQ